MDVLHVPSTVVPFTCQGVQDETSTVPVDPFRKRRIRLGLAWDILLLKSGMMSDSNFSPHGESHTRYIEALTLFWL